MANTVTGAAFVKHMLVIASCYAAVRKPKRPQTRAGSACRLQHKSLPWKGLSRRELPVTWKLPGARLLQKRRLASQNTVVLQIAHILDTASSQRHMCNQVHPTNRRKNIFSEQMGRSIVLASPLVQLPAEGCK